MELTLSALELERLRIALTTLTSPLSYERVGDWRTAARTAIEPLLDADQSVSMLPLAGEPLTSFGPALEGARLQYEAYYHQFDTGFLVKRRELGLEVCHWSQLYHMPSLKRSEIYNDWSQPNGLLDCLGVAIEVSPAGPPAAIVLYHERETAPPFGERGLALMRLLLPAFKSGVHACLAFARRRAELGRVFDDFGEGVLVTDAAGHAVHQTTALTRMLESDPERERLRRTMTRLAVIVGRLAERERSTAHAPDPGEPASREVRTALGRYRIEGSCVAPGLLTRERAVLVTLTRLKATPPSDAELRSRFGLTRREVEVARLIERGKSAPDVARLLGISTHTARHHIEQLRRKFGEHTVGEVAATVRNG